MISGISHFPSAGRPGLVWRFLENKKCHTETSLLSLWAMSTLANAIKFVANAICPGSSIVQRKAKTSASSITRRTGSSVYTPSERLPHNVANDCFKGRRSLSILTSLAEEVKV
jgi:hypothetical protein